MKKTNPECLAEQGERLDDLVIGGLKIYQHEKQFRFSLDAVLLAHFATLKKKARVMDLGTGTGVIPLLLSTRGAAHVEAVELNSTMAGLAQKSVRYNGLEDIIHVYQGDLREVAQRYAAGSFDLVVTNPPYRPLRKGKISEIDGIAAARHEITANLDDIVRAAGYLLHTRARLAMVHLPERLAEIIAAMQRAAIEPKRLRFVHSAAEKKPNMVLVEGVAGASPGLDVEAPLIVYEAAGTYSKEILQYYGETKA